MYNAELMVELEKKLSEEEVDMELIAVYTVCFGREILKMITGINFHQAAVVLTLMAKSMKLGMYYNRAEQANQTNPETISENN